MWVFEKQSFNLISVISVINDPFPIHRNEKKNYPVAKNKPLEKHHLFNFVNRNSITISIGIGNALSQSWMANNVWIKFDLDKEFFFCLFKIWIYSIYENGPIQNEIGTIVKNKVQLLFTNENKIMKRSHNFVLIVECIHCITCRL